MPVDLASPTAPKALPPEALAFAQRHFSAALLAPDLSPPADVVGPKPGKQAQKRFAVYRNNVIVSLTSSLMAAFPTVLALVGEEFFRAMARPYIMQSPPKSPMLTAYGSTFGDFLEGFEPVANLPYLGDVARLEHAWLAAYHAADCPALDPTRLQQVEPELLGDVTFTFHPATRLLSCQNAAYSIWAAHKEDDPASAMAELEHIPQDILITRPEWDVTVVSLPPGGYAFAMALSQGKSLAEAAQLAATQHETFDFALNLGGLLETGALSNLHLPQ